MPSIMCISTSPWNFMFQRPQQLMSLFCQDYKIGYINPPLVTKLALPHEKILQEYTEVINKNLIVLKPRIPKSLNYTGCQYYSELLKGFARKFGFHDIILWICLPQFGYLCGQIGEKLVIYDCQDDYASFSWTPDTTSESDKQLTKKTNIVLTVSEPLKKTKKKLNPFLFPCPQRL